MNELLEQIENSINSGNYLLGLYVSLSLPDICGALESDDGRASGKKYKAWFDKWVSPKYEGRLNGEQCYSYRCGVIHQGRSAHEKLGYSRIIFLEPSLNRTFHNNVLNDAYNIDLKIFCTDIVSSVREWLESIKEDENYIENNKHLMKRHEDGIAPYIGGIPVYG